MLQAIISPAKNMRIANDTFAATTPPRFLPQADAIRQALCALEQQEGDAGLQRLWRVSDRLLAENVERLHRLFARKDLGDPVSTACSAALFSYDGIQYRSMAPEVLDAEALAWLSQHLWILSGFYGALRPFDAVMPYRLEMGATLAIPPAKNLYGFWAHLLGEAIAEAAAQDEDPTVINLASVEYAKAVLPHLPATTRAITIVFGEELRNGKPIQRATASKIARGSMVRWMAENRLEHAEELIGFPLGYIYCSELSDDTTFVFMRAGKRSQ